MVIAPHCCEQQRALSHRVPITGAEVCAKRVPHLLFLPASKQPAHLCEGWCQSQDLALPITSEEGRSPFLQSKLNRTGLIVFRRVHSCNHVVVAVQCYIARQVQSHRLSGYLVPQQIRSQRNMFVCGRSGSYSHWTGPVLTGISSTRPG